MKGNKIDFRSALWEEHQATSHELDEHPAAKRLEDYRNGLLPEDDATAIRRHLVRCPDCAQCLLWLEDPESFGSDLPAASEEEIDGAWKLLRDSTLATDEAAAQVLVSSRFRGRWSAASGILAAAAAVVIVGLAAWVWSLVLENRALTDQLAGAPGLSINSPVVSLSPPSLVRSDSKSDRVTSIPDRKEHYVFLVNFLEESTHEDYALSLSDLAGAEFLREEGLELTERGNITLTVRRALLPEIGFRLRLFGSSNGMPDLLAEYEVRFAGAE